MNLHLWAGITPAMVLVAPGSHSPSPPLTSELPAPRGPITERLLCSLLDSPHEVGWHQLLIEDADPEDLQLALYCCYELHYRGFRGVDAEWEWEPTILDLRRRLEKVFLADVRAAVGPVHQNGLAGPDRLWQIATSGAGPSLSSWVAEHATLDQLMELAIHRSAYQLKEADPHTWAIPRIGGEAKASMVAIQADEYGAGDPARMHSALFAQTMAALGLDPRTNYLDLIPGVTLATTNLISLFGLHRRWRGSLVGHLALFEMTSVTPMSRYAAALRRLGLPEVACQFYDVHVEADVVHQHVAADGMVAGLLRDEPALAADVLFGALALDAVESGFTRHVLDHWNAGRTSLR